MVSGIFDVMMVDDFEVWLNVYVCMMMMLLATRARDADKALVTLEWMKRWSVDV